MSILLKFYFYLKNISDQSEKLFALTFPDFG